MADEYEYYDLDTGEAVPTEYLEHMITTGELEFYDLDTGETISDDHLEHFGIRGMKWGIRRKRRVERLARAGKEGGPGVTKVRTATIGAFGLPIGLGSLGPIDLIKGRGVTGAAKRKAIRVGARLKRIDQGKASVMDWIKQIGSTKFSDLFPVRTKNIKKKTSTKGDWVPAIAGGTSMAIAGSLLAARMLLGTGELAVKTGLLSSGDTDFLPAAIDPARRVYG